MEFPHHAVVFFNFHEGLQIHIGNAGGLFMNGKQQIQIVLIKLCAADFPHAFAHGRLGVQRAVIVAEFAGGVAFIGFSHGGKPCAQQAGFASAGEFAVVPHIIGAALQGFQMRNPAHQLPVARVHRRFDLRENGQGDFRLARHQILILRQGGKKRIPGKRVFLGNFHPKLLRSR